MLGKNQFRFVLIFPHSDPSAENYRTDHWQCIDIITTLRQWEFVITLCAGHDDVLLGCELEQRKTKFAISFNPPPHQITNGILPCSQCPMHLNRPRKHVRELIPWWDSTLFTWKSSHFLQFLSVHVRVHWMRKDSHSCANKCGGWEWRLCGIKDGNWWAMNHHKCTHRNRFSPSIRRSGCHITVSQVGFL